MRILAIDYGGRWVGLAISDPTQTIAQPFDTLDRRKLNKKALLDKISSMVKEQDVGTVVVGLPLGMYGEVGMAAKKAIAFAKELEKVLDVPVIMHDESFSSAEAESFLSTTAGLSGRKRKNVVDKMAAAIILRSFLDSRSRADG